MTESTVTPFEDFSQRLRGTVAERNETLEAIDNNYAKALAAGGAAGDLHQSYLAERASVINMFKLDAISIGKDYTHRATASSPPLPTPPAPSAAHPPPHGKTTPAMTGSQPKQQQGGRMFKPRFVLTAVGLVIAVIGAACGYLLPVGRFCSGAFALQKASKEAAKTVGGMAALTACHTNADQFAPIWTAVIVVGLALFTIGLLWILVVRGRSALAKRNRSDRARSTPIWPLLLGLVIIGGGIFLGHTVDVGPYCDGAFTQQTSAAGADIASAMSGRLSNYSDECRAAAGQQSVIYWGIIGFGGAVFVLGLVLQTVLGRRQSTGSRPGTIADELEQLARLLERGVLTRDEFARQKEKLLSRG